GNYLEDPAQREAVERIKRQKREEVERQKPQIREGIRKQAQSAGQEEIQMIPQEIQPLIRAQLEAAAHSEPTIDRMAEVTMQQMVDDEVAAYVVSEILDKKPIAKFIGNQLEDLEKERKELTEKLKEAAILQAGKEFRATPTAMRGELRAKLKEE